MDIIEELKAALRLIAEIDGPLPAGSSQDWRRRVQLIAKQALHAAEIERNKASMP